MSGLAPVAHDLSFVTGRMEARAMMQDDQALFCALYTDTDTMRFVAPAMPADRAASCFSEVLASMCAHPPERLFLTLFDKASGGSLGLCGIARFDATRDSAEIGIMLKFSERARGLGREAVCSLVATAFDRLPIRQVWAQYAPGNAAFCRIASSLGFARCENRTRLAVSATKLAQSIDRRAWDVRQTQHQRGASHVESTGNSGSAGTGRRAATCG